MDVETKITHIQSAEAMEASLNIKEEKPTDFLEIARRAIKYSAFIKLRL